MPSAPGVQLDTTPRNGCCRATFGFCRGTIQKSETYKISGAAERRTVSIRELVENKREQLKTLTIADFNGYAFSEIVINEVVSIRAF